MQCMSCGCCLEACPQYAKVEVARFPGESAEAAGVPAKGRPTTRNFVGATPISQMVFYNSHPTGASMPASGWTR